MIAVAVRRPSPALGIGYGLWLRGRGPFATACLVVVGLALATSLVPALRDPFALGAGVSLAVPPILFAVPIVLLPVVSLLNVFTYGPIDVSAKASPFPIHVRLLPMSTRALVGWPMLFAVVTIGALWLVLLAFVLRPLGLTTSVLWPTTIVLACTAWVQAIAWIPLPFRFLRVPLFLAFVGLPLGLATIDPRSGDFFWSFEAGMAAWTIGAYVLATLGLHRARTGAAEIATPIGSPRPAGETAEPTGPMAPVVAKPFPSAGAASRWYELRRTTAFFAKAFAIAPLPFVALCLLAVGFPRSVLAYRMTPIGIPVATMWATIFLILGPLFASAALGGFVGRLDHGPRYRLGAFLALRPVSTARIVADKLVSAGFAAAVLFASSAVVAAFALGAYAAHAPPHVVAILEQVFTTRGLLDATLLAAGFALLLWRNLAVDLWTTMLGRVWPSRVVAGSAGAALAALPLTLVWLANHPAIARGSAAAFPWVVCALVAGKLAVAIVGARQLAKRGLVKTRVVLAFGGGWCAAVIIVLVAASWFVAVSWTAGFVVAALVPLARITLAPLALDRSRHA